MNNNRDQAQLEQLVFRYLYGDLNEQEKQRFEAGLDSNPQLQSLLAEEQALEAMIPRGSAPLIDEGRLQHNRNAVLQKLTSQHSEGQSVTSSMLALLQRPGWLAAQTAALALAFVLGGMLDSTSVNAPALASQISPLDLVGDEDYEIYSMQINAFDAQSGAIDLSFSLASESRFIGNVADTGIRVLIDAALRNNIEDADRLEAVEILQYASLNSSDEIQVSDGLIYALGSDNNPGVRYSAASSLAAHADNENVRGALRQALSEDSNPGVRMVAFDALAQNPDPSTLALFRQRMEFDSDTYIRDQARSIIDQFENDGLESERF